MTREPTFAEGLIGVVLDGRYRLDAILGEGGMGSVFRATHVAMDRKVAVKLLKPHLTSDDHALQRFAAEARRTMRVESPHAVKVLDFGVTEHRDYYMVLEYLDGRTVQRELEVDGPFAPARVIHIARQALAALGAAHASGLVHRDIKPDNLLLMRAGDDPDFTKVLDFGVAKLMEGAAPSSRSALKLTQQGMVFGTPEFMSPEQACGLALDGRSDLYALAATMFAMLTGCGLFTGNSAIEWLTHHARTPPPHLAQIRPELANLVALDALIQRCLSKRADLRPADAAAMDALLAEVERAPASALPEPAAPVERKTTPERAMLKTVFSPSSFVEALAPVASLDTLHAPVERPLVRPPTEEPVEAAPARKRSGAMVALGAIAMIAIVGAVVAVVAVSGTKSTARTDRAPRADAGAVASSDAPPSVVIADDASLPVPMPVPLPVPDAGAIAQTHSDAGAGAHPAPPPPHPLPPPPPGPHPPNPDVDNHLNAARQAQAAGNRLGELAQAQAALKLDPTNVQATYLMGDALLASGDTDRGCKILSNIKRFPLALQRMKVANCPD